MHTLNSENCVRRQDVGGIKVSSPLPNWGRYGIMLIFARKHHSNEIPCRYLIINRFGTPSISVHRASHTRFWSRIAIFDLLLILTSVRLLTSLNVLLVLDNKDYTVSSCLTSLWKPILIRCALYTRRYAMSTSGCSRPPSSIYVTIENCDPIKHRR